MIKIRRNTFQQWIVTFLASSVTLVGLANSLSSRHPQYTSSNILPMNEIIVESANYYSSATRNLYCDPRSFVKTTCDHKSTCKIFSSDALCGNPDTRPLAKVLLVTYNCGFRAKVVSAEQGQYATLDCSIE